MSALPPKADIAERDPHVRFVPSSAFGSRDIRPEKPVIEGDDLADAKSQSTAMKNAKTSSNGIARIDYS
jgi:hypothetical protein